MRTNILDKTKALNQVRVASREFLVSRDGVREMFRKFGLPVSPNFFSSLIHYKVLVKVSRKYYSWEDTPIHHEKVKLIYSKYHSYQEKYAAKQTPKNKQAQIEAAIKLLKDNGYMIYQQI